MAATNQNDDVVWCVSRDYFFSDKMFSENQVCLSRLNIGNIIPQ